jgi:hypothetical protein
MGCQQAFHECGVLHGVVQLAEAMMMNGRRGDRSALDIKHNSVGHLTVPGSGGCMSSTLSIQIVILGRLRGTCMVEKGSHPIPELLSVSGYIPKLTKSLDVQLILGEPVNEAADYHVLNMRLFTFRCGFSDFEGLFRDMVSILPKGGYEAHRSGGSLGRPMVDKDFFDFIHVPGVLPRKAGSTKILLRDTKTKKGFEVFWISARCKEPTVKSFFYYPPKLGGHRCLPSKFILKYDALLKFAESRVYAAMILNEISSGRIRDAVSKPIASAAVTSMLNFYDEALRSTDNKDGSQKEALLYIATKGEHTFNSSSWLPC